MLATQPSKELHALCHEHHVEMRLNRILLKSERKDLQSAVYACSEPDCVVHYSISRGYFILSQVGSTSELDMVPSVRCPFDGMPMYLAEINQQKQSFRLWRCPQCGAGRTNQEGLVREASG